MMIADESIEKVSDDGRDGGSCSTTAMATCEPDTKSFTPQDIPTCLPQPGNSGLYNLGNTCYMNSTLQCLLHNPSLLEYFLTNRKFSAGLLNEFHSLIEKYWSGKWSVIVPNSFKDFISITHPQFSGSSQHDGQEFLALFLGSMHQEGKTFDEVCDRASPINTKICNDLRISDDNAKRKRTESIEYLDNCLPNHKTVDVLHQTGILHLTTLIGKEKKTPNVNVLNTDVECDEEITTDHSNKYPQAIGSRLNNGQLFQLSMTNRQNPFECENSDGEHEPDLKQPKLSDTKFKQTNLLADLKRQGKTDSATETGQLEKFSFGSSAEMFDLKREVGTSSILTYNVNTTLSPFVKTTFGSELLKDEYLLPADRDCLGVGDWDKTMAFKCNPYPVPNFEKTSVPLTSLDSCEEEISVKRKIFSLKHPDKPSIFQLKYNPPFSISVTNKQYKIANSSNNFFPQSPSEQNSGLESMTGEKGSLVTKFTNILVDETQKPSVANVENVENNVGCSKMPDKIGANNSRYLSQTNSSKEEAEQSSDAKMQSHLTAAEVMWEEYTEKNHSVIVDNFQGQLESVVSCCKCGNTSVIYEPFMYLSVPIPHALQTLVDVRLVPLNGDAIKISVYVPKHGQVIDLKQAINQEIMLSPQQVDVEKYVFCEMKSFSVFYVLENTTPIRSINPTRRIEAFEIIDIVPNDGESNGTSNCCICLEDFADPELLRHNAESCSVMICHACLQSSVQHYGVDSFSCPICHSKCSPNEDFLQLAPTSTNRDVVISVNFSCVGDDGILHALARPALIRTTTSLPRSTLNHLLEKFTQGRNLPQNNFVLAYCSLDGLMCSRCSALESCKGCEIVDGDVVCLQPGDNICVRYSDVGVSKVFSHEIKMDLSEKSPVTLDMCLQAFTKNETLDDNNPWYCVSCESHQIAEKQLRICKWPNTLILYIKRFLYHSKAAVKVDDEVMFPVDSFNPGVLSGTDPSQNKIYDLSACISHYGGVHSGHYTASCKHATTSKWHLYNDDVVTEQELSTKDTSGAYVLFYQQRE